VNKRKDSSDFALTSLVRLYYMTAGTGKLTLEQENAIKNALLNWKFWLDEPKTTYVEMWTENHQILKTALNTWQDSYSWMRCLPIMGRPGDGICS
jgi:hypothetical protein